MEDRPNRDNAILLSALALLAVVPVLGWSTPLELSIPVAIAGLLLAGIAALGQGNDDARSPVHIRAGERAGQTATTLPRRLQRT
jgi:hypothetical protein